MSVAKPLTATTPPQKLHSVQQRAIPDRHETPNTERHPNTNLPPDQTLPLTHTTAQTPAVPIANSNIARNAITPGNDAANSLSIPTVGNRPQP